jgi:hypothetical protein
MASTLHKRTFVILVLSWAVASSLLVYPHSHSYFNELAGGPHNGWKHLHCSSVDWGQDITYLKAWLNKHPSVKRIGIAAKHWADMRELGFNSFKPNRWPVPDEQLYRQETDVGPQPGWYAVRLCHLAGEPRQSYWGRPSEAYALDPSWSYFRQLRPVDRIGCSMNIYHVSLQECNDLRLMLGLTPVEIDTVHSNE